MAEFLTFITAHGAEIVAQFFIAAGALTALLGALYSLFLLIPGDQPDKIIKAIYDLTVKISKK